VFKSQGESRPKHANGGVAYDNVQASHLLAEYCKCLRKAFGLADVRLKRQRAAPESADVRANRFSFVLAGMVQDGDIATCPGQFEGCSAANAARGACHQRYLAD
jgi:hypothetical protein